MHKKFVILKSIMDKLFLINILLWIFLGIVFSILGIFIGYVALFIYILLIIIISLISFYLDYKLKKDFKNYIMPKIVKDFHEDWNYGYSTDGYISKADFYQTGFINTITNNSYKSEDLIYGKISNMDFKSCDINCHFLDSDDKNSKKIKLFNGRFYQVILPFNINGHFVLYDEKKQIDDMIFEMKKIENVPTEYNDLFDIYSTDSQLPLKYLNHESFEHIKNLKKSFIGKLFFSIDHNILSIGLCDDKNRFELKKSYKALFAQLLIEKEILEKITTIIK